MAIWRKVGLEQQVPDRLASEVAGLLKDVLAYADISAGRPSLDAYDGSLRRFMEVDPTPLHDPRLAQGWAYWAALCTVTAFCREAVTDEDRQTILASYDGVLEEVTDLLSANLIATLPADVQQAWSERIAAGLKEFGQVLHDRIAELEGDFLCPAFKRPITPAAAQRVLAHCGNTGLYPVYREPVTMMATADEAYGMALGDFFSNALRECLFLLFVEDVGSMLHYNPYWGYTRYSAQSTDGWWPAIVRMVPAQEINEVKEWRRD